MAQPEVVLSSRDVDRIDALLSGLPSSEAATKSNLEAELERGRIVEPGEVPPDVVTMNSSVRFSIASSGEQFSKTLVFPRDADGSADRVSILAPVGSALLGLSTGSTIEWPRHGGGHLTVRIDEIVYRPERAGDYHL